MHTVELASVGDAGAAALAGMAAVYELYLFAYRRERREHLWLAVLCGCAAVYAAAMAVHYNVGPVTALWLTRLEAVALVGLVHACAAFLGNLTGRWFLSRRAVFTSAAGSTLLVLSPWVISGVEAVEMSWLSSPFWRRPQRAPLVAMQLWGFVVVIGASYKLLRARDEFPLESRHFIVGLVFWALPTLQVVVLSALHKQPPISVVEYGFVAFAIALASHDARRYMQLLGESEKRADAASEETRIAEAVYQTLIERMPNGVAVIERGRFSYVNPALCRIAGVVTADGLIGKSPLKLVAKHDRGRAVSLASGSGPHELTLLGASGDRRRVEVDSVSLELRAGPAQLVFVRDVTEQRLLTAHLMEMDRMVAVGTLAAGVGHEINNPLSYMLLNLHYCREQLATAPTSLADALGAPLQESIAGGKRIQTIVSALSAMSRSDLGRSPVAVSTAIDSAVAICGNEIRHRAHLVVEHDPSALVVANEARLSQVFLNLLLNASHALSASRRDAAKIHVRSFQEDDQVVVEVRDNGPGVPRELIQRIFDPFFTTKPVGEGTGLGLSICRDTVFALGGRLEVESEPGDGACFRVVMPATDAPMEEVPTSKPRGAGPRPRVLFIDDEPGVLRAVRRAIGRDVELVTCDSGRAALEKISRDGRFDLVITDLMMPGLSGMDVFSALQKTHPELANGMLFTTGGAFTPEARALTDSFGDRVVPKPVGASELLSRIRAVTQAPSSR